MKIKIDYDHEIKNVVECELGYSFNEHDCICKKHSALKSLFTFSLNLERWYNHITVKRVHTDYSLYVFYNNIDGILTPMKLIAVSWSKERVIYARSKWDLIPFTYSFQDVEGLEERLNEIYKAVNKTSIVT